MKIKPEHKRFLLDLGLRVDDFALFDGRFVRYACDENKGVRLYDPYYATSYDEYIDVDGWSAWSGEKDTFMSDILKGAREETRRRESLSPQPDKNTISDSLKKKFKTKKDD